MAFGMMPMDELVALVNEHGTLPRELDGRAGDPRDPDDAALADELHPIFAVRDQELRARMINDLLRRTAVRPHVSSNLAEEWTVDDPGQTRRAAAALALRHQLASHGGRIGVCEDGQCADVYVDLSPAGRRRFCCLTCQNRSRAAAFRRRHAAR